MAISPQWLTETWVETSGIKGKAVLCWVRWAWAMPCVQPDLNLLLGQGVGAGCRVGCAADFPLRGFQREEISY